MQNDPLSQPLKDRPFPQLAVIAKRQTILNLNHRPDIIPYMP